MRAKRRIKLFAMNRDCKEMAISEYLPCFLFVFLINTNTRLHEKLNVCFIARPKLQCLKISACDDVYTFFTFQCSSFTYIPASFHNPFSCGGLFARKRCDTKMVQLENERRKEGNVEWVNFPFISGMHAVDSQSAMALCCMHMQQTKRLCVSSF